MPPAPSLGRAATWPTTRTPWSSSLGRPASTSWRAWRPLRAGLLCPTSPPTSTGRSSQPPRAPSTRPRRSGNIWPPRDARAPASLSRPVPSASPSREERSPLNLGARVGLYAMLAGLVLASFLVKPETAASKLAGPVASAVPEPARAEVLARGAARAHSAAEAQVRYVYHDGPDGTAQSRDVPVCGTGWYGENTGKIWNGNVDALHIEFMVEPWEPINHRTNIMDASFRRVGVGAVMGTDAMYMTMVFCR